jgi:putative ABC transport system permease protein
MELGPIFRALMHNPTRFWLIGVEIALTLAIVVNCVAIILEQRHLLTRPSGLDEPNLVVVTTDPFTEDFAEDEFIDMVRDEDLRRLRALPGVRAAAAIDYVPLAGGGSLTGLRGSDNDGDGQPSPFFEVGLGAIDALGVEIVAGRDHMESDLRPGDDEPTNLIMTQALADKIFPDGDALGNTVADPDTGEVFGHVVGIIRQMHNAWPRSSIAGSAMLIPGPPNDQRRIRYMVRTEPGALEAVFNELEPTMLAVNADRIVTIRPISEYKRRYFDDEIVLVKVLTWLAVLLVGVTSLGIIGLTSFSVTQRTREIGTRRALGATRGAVLRYFVIEIWLISGIGLALGAVLTYALNYVLAHLADAPAIGLPLIAGGIFILWAIGLASALAPAFRATLVPPVVTTRTV